MLGLVAAHGLSLVAARGDYSSLWCAGFSPRWLLCTGSRQAGFSSCGVRASVVVARRLSSCGSRALERRLSSCGARALLLRGRWDLPRPGLEPVSPALAGRFSTPAPPGKPLHFLKLRPAVGQLAAVEGVGASWCLGSVKLHQPNWLYAALNTAKRRQKGKHTFLFFFKGFLSRKSL